ncbi:MAG: hypothetical protein ACOYM3_33030, partial [Terrimicrobiaceae bacterium]
TLSPAVVPGSLFLPTSFPREETIGVGSDSRPLLPRHLLMSKDGTIEIDKLLDFGRYSCGCFPFSPNHEAKLETGSPENRSDSGAAWLTKEEVVVFAPGWLLTHLLGKYLSGDMIGLLSTARESLLRALTPHNPRRAKGRLFHADFEAINNLAFPSQDSADQMFKRFNEIRVSDGLLRNVATFDLSSPALVSMGAELSDEFLPAGFCWFMRSVDASFLLQVAGDTEIAERGENDLRFLNQLIYQGILAQIGPSTMSPSNKRMRTFADHLLMILYTKGAGEFRSEGGELLVEAVGDTCMVLMRKFADNMTRLAFRYALEGAGILATLGNPPYPVAAWSRKWLFSQWKRYAFSQGSREVKKILKQFDWVKRVKHLSKAERLRQTGDGHTVGEAVDDIVEPLSKAESG